jgi:mRNA interferase HigB
VRLLGKDEVNLFMQKHPNSRKPLNAWVKSVENCFAKNFTELKTTFGSVDYVSKSKHTIFDVGGNKFRVITSVIYTLPQVVVVAVLTHAEYSKRENI